MTLTQMPGEKWALTQAFPPIPCSLSESLEFPVELEELWVRFLATGVPTQDHSALPRSSVEKSRVLAICLFLSQPSTPAWGTPAFFCINFRLCVNIRLGSLEKSVLQPSFPSGVSTFPGAGILGQELNSCYSVLTANGKTRRCWGRAFT